MTNKTNENPNYKKLIAILEEVFQLNQADLDFGIYRIMNHRRDRITRFMQQDLIPQVKTILRDELSEDKGDVQEELDKLVKTLTNAGMNPDDSPKVTELRAKLTGATDIEAEENQVFGYLAAFFRRYYDGGDFISLRRYKKDTYAIPYEGEEVKLHWANHDQYYIKTSEYLKNYAFKINDGAQTVRFVLKEAGTEQNNNKAAAGKERRFALYTEKPLTVTDGELHLHFTYEPTDKKTKQADLLQAAFDTLKTQLPAPYQTPLLQRSPTPKNPERTLLEKHLRDYSARNTFDYFIHKDLGGFLRRELDFFIKNEVLHLDDIGTRDTAGFVRQLSKIRALKEIGGKVIDFLAQLENFQKKLWLKKKFVTDVQYCLTLDRVPESLYAEIAANDAQREEWKRLFHIQDIKKDEDGDLFTVDYSEPLTTEFLKANPFLVLDTAFFPVDFKDRLVASIDNLDESLDGLLINSENFQALNLLQERYREGVDGIYIDPPYNSPSSLIIYKNDYKHSSFLSLMNDRLLVGKNLLTDKASNIIAIDENEQNGLLKIVTAIFEEYDNVLIAVEHNKKGIQGKHFSYSSEFAIFSVSNERKVLNRISMPRKEWSFSNLRNWGGESERHTAKNCFYPIVVKNGEIVRIDSVCDDDYHPEQMNMKIEDEILVYPIDSEGIERKWRYAQDTVQHILDKLIVEEDKTGNCQIKIAKNDKQFKTIWNESKYNAGDYGTKVLTKMGFKKGSFTFPKAVPLVRDSIVAVSDNDATILDYFAGSGTTAHAVINLNREDDGKRKYILVEMGEYFDTVTKPRVQKVIYSPDWKDGKPVSRAGSSHAFKYLRLESYEDTLNNLKNTDLSPAQQDNLRQSERYREGYLLQYMLDTELRDSLLDTERFADPFSCYLDITRANETVKTRIDLVETFNYLIGLRVARMYTLRGFRVVEGKTRAGEETLVIWRNVAEKSNADLDAFFLKQNYNTRDTEFDRIYVNGDNNLENLKTDGDRWKVVLTEEAFGKLMFGG